LAIIDEIEAEAEWDSTVALIPRNGNRQPLIIPPGGGDLVAYNRPSSFVKPLEDRHKLELYNTRKLAEGLVLRPDLLLSISRAMNIEDPAARKTEEDKFVAEALVAGGADIGSNMGTALHGIFDEMDAGRELVAIPMEYLPGLAAYERVKDWFRMVELEEHGQQTTFVVWDENKLAGSFDRLVQFKMPEDPDAPQSTWPFSFTPDSVRDTLYIWDNKTNQNPQWSWLAWAGQTCIYSRGVRYTPDGTRSPLGNGLPVNQDWGIICHVPSKGETATLYWIDLNAGLEAVELTLKIRALRSRASKMKDLFYHIRPLTVREQIEQATSRTELRELWQAHKGTDEWSSDLEDLFKTKAETLPDDRKATK
jgi:hypothetical protein